MITKYQHIMLGKLYYPSYVSALPYVPKNDLSLIKSSLYRVSFSRMYNLDTDIIYKIEAK